MTNRWSDQLVNVLPTGAGKEQPPGPMLLTVDQFRKATGLSRVSSMHQLEPGAFAT